jgi:type IV secretory pathway protease TraF
VKAIAAVSAAAVSASVGCGGTTDGGYERGTLVAYRPPTLMLSRCGGLAFDRPLGRIVAVPGDEVLVENGEVSVNGELAAPSGDSSMNVPKREVPDGSYFVVRVSNGRVCDSRVWGFLPEDHIVAAAGDE